VRIVPQHTVKELFKLQMIDRSTIAINIEPDIEFELEDAKCVSEAIDALADGKKLYHLLIFGDRTVPSREARHFFINGI
jgi:hypothetical protein